MMLGLNKNVIEICKRIPRDSVGVELGVWKGNSSEMFLERACHLHLVDPWSIDPYLIEENEFGGIPEYFKRYAKIVGGNTKEAFERYYDFVYASVVKRFHSKSVTIHRCTTDIFFETFKEKVDWVYIDALHTFEGCLSDLRNSLRILLPGGFIFGDDYKNKLGVTKAVQAFIETTSGVLFEALPGNQYEIRRI